MNVTREATFGTWNRRKLQLILSASVAALAVGIAVAAGSGEFSSGGSATVSTQPVAPTVRISEPALTFYYIVDSAEEAELAIMAENELLAAAAAYGASPDHSSFVIDVSTLEGQQELNAVHAAQAEAFYESGYLPDVRFIDWTK